MYVGERRNASEGRHSGNDGDSWIRRMSQVALWHATSVWITALEGRGRRAFEGSPTVR